MRNLDEKLRDYFNGRSSDRESETIHNWLVRNAGNAEFDHSLRVLWDDIRDIADEETGQDAFEKFCLNIPQAVRRSRFRKMLVWTERIAAVLALPLVVVSIYFADQSSKPRGWVEESVPLGQKKEVVLPDNSVVWLNAGSKLIYPERFNGRTRQVYVAGEAFLDVAHDSRRPFYLSTGNMNIEVLGTRFNVKSYTEENNTEVSLVEGSIRLDVDFNGEVKHYRMKPGTSFRFDHLTGSFDSYHFAPAEYQSWSEGNGLYFRNVPLEEITMALERRFGVEIVIRSESLKHDKYFASFVNDESLNEILDALNVSGGMKIDYRDGVIDISPAKT